MKFRKFAWMVVSRRGGSPLVCESIGPVFRRNGHLQIFTTRKEAEGAASGSNYDVVKVTLLYEWEWVPK